MTHKDIEALRDDIVIQAVLRGQPVTLHSTWGLFSPKEVDEGTRLLIEHLPIRPDDDCLDLGCGYGPVGIAMAREAARGTTLMVDKDFVAVRYALANARRNGLSNVDAQLSNGVADIDPARRFDLVAANLPAKVGRELLTIFVHDAHARLNPGGRMAVVAISQLRPVIERAFMAAFGNAEKIKQGRRYVVMGAVNAG
ncbi:MAG: methyltransferase, partial [Ardenticatenales bacterium]